MDFSNFPKDLQTQRVEEFYSDKECIKRKSNIEKMKVTKLIAKVQRALGLSYLKAFL